MSNQHEYLYQSNDKKCFSSFFKILNGLSSQKKLQNEPVHFEKSIINPFSLSDDKQISYSFLTKKQRRQIKGNSQQKSYKKSWTVDEYRRFTIVFLMKTHLRVGFCKEIIDFFSSRTRQQIHSHYLRLKLLYNQFQALFFTYFPSYKVFDTPIKKRRKGSNQSLTRYDLENLFLQIQSDLTNEEFAAYLKNNGFDNSVVYDKFCNYYICEPLHYVSNRPLLELTNTINPKDFSIDEKKNSTFTFSEKKPCNKKKIGEEDDYLMNKDVVIEVGSNFTSKIENFRENNGIVIDEDFLIEFAAENFQMSIVPNDSNIFIR